MAGPDDATGPARDREYWARILHDAWPHTVISEALSKATGLPIGTVLTWDAVKQAGADCSGLYRFADAVAAALQSAPSVVSREALEVAAKDLLAGMSGTYKARNGREMGIEADDGEKCWIVHSDLIAALERALVAIPCPDAPRYLRFVGSMSLGIWQVRIGKRFWFVKAPWIRPLYSERAGHGVRVLARCRGWRFGWRRIT